MSAQTINRKLTTIFYADVAGYSRLTGQDEAGTHRRVMEVLDFVTDSIKADGGTVLRYSGDAILAEFSSVIGALNTASIIQTTLSNDDVDVSNQTKVQIRIGVNLGEVIQDRGEIYGDGVNLAARLEATAQPGGICISSTVFDQVEGKIDLQFTDGGAESFKNINKPTHIYRWAPDGHKAVSGQKVNKDTVPTIYIEKFACLPDDDENQIFAEELYDQLLLRMSKRTGIRVVDQSGQDSPLNASDYTLRGRINRLSSRCRANLSMIWCSTRETVWADSFSGSIDDPLNFIDEIIDSVDAEIRTQINAFDARRLSDQSESELGPSELLTKAAELFYRVNIDDWRHAIALIDKALATRPEHAMSLSMRVEGGVVLASVISDDLHDEDDGRLSEMADHAIELNNQSDHAFFARGYLKIFRLGDFEGALDDAKQTITLSPSYAPGFEVMGQALLCMENASEANEAFERAVTLSKKSPFAAYYTSQLALARFLAGDLTGALKDIDSALQLHRGVWAFHQLKGAILFHQEDPSANKWLEQAQKLIDVPHPFGARLPLPESYARMLMAQSGSLKRCQPKLRVV